MMVWKNLFQKVKIVEDVKFSVDIEFTEEIIFYCVLFLLFLATKKELFLFFVWAYLESSLNSDESQHSEALTLRQ